MKPNRLSLVAISLLAIPLLFGLATTMAIDTVLVGQEQEAEAKGCPPGGTGFNASQGKCDKPDN